MLLAQALRWEAVDARSIRKSTRNKNKRSNWDQWPGGAVSEIRTAYTVARHATSGFQRTSYGLRLYPYRAFDNRGENFSMTPGEHLDFRYARLERRRG